MEKGKDNIKINLWEKLHCQFDLLS